MTNSGLMDQWASGLVGTAGQRDSEPGRISDGHEAQQRHALLSFRAERIGVEKSPCSAGYYPVRRSLIPFS